MVPKSDGSLHFGTEIPDRSQSLSPREGERERERERESGGWMAGDDRISALPEEIKVSILSRMPITHAVCTSALSRSWRHLWTLVPGYYADLSVAQGPDEIVSWIEFADHFLSSLRGPIRYFFHRSSVHANPLPDLQHYLDLIFQKGGLWILYVHYMARPVRVQLPYFRLLKELRLHWVVITLPGDFGGFEQLTTLELFYVRISQQDIQSLIDGSKKLTSIRCHLWPEDAASEQPLSVNLNCPLLKYLRFYFGKHEAEARIISAPCLESTRVTASRGPDQPLEELVWVGAATLKFMADIAQVSHLSLEGNFLRVIVEFDWTNL